MPVEAVCVHHRGVVWIALNVTVQVPGFVILHNINVIATKVSGGIKTSPIAIENQKRHLRIKMQSAYLCFKHSNILCTSDEPLQSDPE